MAARRYADSVPASTPYAPAASPPPRPGSGLGFAITAYTLWGFLPIYFVALTPSSPFEIVALRILFSLVFCALLLTVTRTWPAFIGLLRDRRVLGTMAIAGVFIYVNWQVYVIASTGGHIVEASLGYFINPLVTVLLGVIVLRERLRSWQWVAVGISAVAVLVIAIGYGQFPFIALALAFSFGIYGFIKKRVGGRVDAISGLTLETLWLTPVAAVQLAVVGSTIGLTLGTQGPWHTALLLSAGVVTAVPLLFFAAGARRLTLVALGLTQYSAPVLQLIVGVVIMREDMPIERWIGFGLVWVALLVLTVDMIVAQRAPKRASLEPA